MGRPVVCRCKARGALALVAACCAALVAAGACCVPLAVAADEADRVVCETETQVRMFFSDGVPGEADGTQLHPLPTGEGDTASAANVVGSAATASSIVGVVAEAPEPAVDEDGGARQAGQAEALAALLPAGQRFTRLLMVSAAVLATAAALFCVLGRRLGKRRV